MESDFWFCLKWKRGRAQISRISAQNPQVTNSIKRENGKATEGLKLPSVLLKEEIALSRFSLD